jgi:enamine deaminase RidA (YjgF/YER057c/UK114 family)
MSEASCDLRARLARHGIELRPGAPLGPWHLPATLDDLGLVHVSGQVPVNAEGGLVASGRLVTDADLPRGRACAQQCAVNVLAELDRVAGGLHRVERVHKLTVFVASDPGFVSHPQVAQVASELIHDVLGDAGRHARSAIGVSSLPLDVPVEIEAVARVCMEG